MYPVLAELGPLRLYGYGAMVALGGILACLFLRRARARMGLSKDEHFWLLVNVLLFSGFVGGRLLFLAEYVPFSSPDFWAHAVSPNRGFSVLGAFLGVTAGVYALGRALDADSWRLLDYVSAAASLWHVPGRLGCFLAGCCHGRPTEAPWAVVFRDPRSHVPEELLGVALHPTQLYEAAANAFVAAVLILRVLPQVEDGRLGRGAALGAYMMLFALLRLLSEVFRGDTVLLGWGLTVAQALAVVLLAAGAWLLRRFAIPCSRS